MVSISKDYMQCWNFIHVYMILNSLKQMVMHAIGIKLGENEKEKKYTNMGEQTSE